jgi:hypothetical protein
MIEQINASEFEKLVIKYYKFLIDDFGFTLNKLGDWSFSLETLNARVSLLAERPAQLTVALEPIGEEAKKLLRRNIFPKAMDVIVIAMCLDSSLQYKIARLNNKSIASNISVEMNHRAELLKKYCKKMLSDDFSDWDEIGKCMSERAYEFLNI